MVENRKYNQEEIYFVQARALAGWKQEIIAKAFKQQFAAYWADREFTKKQVNYIKNTYKLPNGAVARYDGPVPQFPPSPTPGVQVGTGPSTATRRQQKRLYRAGQSTSQVQDAMSGPISGFATGQSPYAQAQQPQQLRATTATPLGQSYGYTPSIPQTPTPTNMTNLFGDNASGYIQGQQAQYPGNITINPKVHGQNPQSIPQIPAPVNMTPMFEGVPAINSANLSTNASEPFASEDYLNFDAIEADFASGGWDFSNAGISGIGVSTMPTSGTSPGLGGAGADQAAGSSGQQGSIIQGTSGFDVGQDLLGIGSHVGKTDTGCVGQMTFGDTNFPASGLDPHLNMAEGQGQGQTSNLSPEDINGLFAESPFQSIEGDVSSTGAAHGLSVGANMTTDVPIPMQQQLTAPNFQTQFPPGRTAASTAMGNKQGVWCYGAHDMCQIALEHRHEMDGGVYFSSVMAVVQSFLAMNQQEGIGFLLGLASGTQLAGQPQSVWSEATRTARDTLVPGAQLQGHGGHVLTAGNINVPEAGITERLTQINQVMPANHYLDPFTSRVVRYNMPQDAAAGNGGQNNASNLGTGAQAGAQ